MSIELFHYLLIHWLIAIIPISLGIFVLVQDRHNSLYHAFLRYNLAISWWGAFNLAMEYSANANYALFWDRVSLLGIVFIPATFLNFTWMYSGKSIYYGKAIRLCYLLSGFFFLFSFSPWMAQSATPKHVIPFFTDPGFLYHFFVIYFIVIMTTGNILLLRAYLKADTPLRKRGIRLFLIATAISTIGGGGNFMVPYKIYTPILFPYGGYSFILYGILITYTILRYRFLNIELFIKRTIVFTGLLAMVMVVVAVISALVNGFISRWFAVPQGVVAVGSSLIVIVFFDPVRTILVNWTDRFLFQKNQDFKVALNRLSRSIVSILEIDTIAKTILSTLDQTLRLETVAIFIKDESGKEYQILDSYGSNLFGKRIAADHIMIQYLSGQSEIINLQDTEESKSLPLEITNTMNEFMAKLAIPLRVEGDLVGLLFWGKKKSDQEFTQDELSFLPAVAAQVAIAFSYARAIDILKKSQIDFAQQSKLAALGTLSAGISHEIKNPMNQIGMAVSMLKFKEKNNLYSEASPEDFKKEVFESLDRVENDVKRVNDIVERLSAFAKKPKEIKLEDVRVSEVLDGVLAIIETEFRNHQIQVIKKYEAVSLIRADYHAVEEVMLNLLVNAQHAIREKGVGHGVITVEIKNRPVEVEVSVRDSGVGIPSENFEKIFDPFFTTKDVSRNPDPNAIKGTGLGLHLIREILKRYGGRIVVESVLGEGTLFRVLFPISV